MKIDAFLSVQNIISADMSNILSRLNIGDIFRARIIEMTSNELLLKLFDGTTVKASTEVDLGTKAGGYIDLAVKEKTDGQLFLETVGNKGTFESDKNDVGKQLLKLQIELNSRNIQIAGGLKANNLPITKENFLKILQVMESFKDITAAKATFLQANNLMPEVKNIEALNQLIEGRFKLTGGISEILRLLNSVEDKSLISEIAEKLQADNQQSFNELPEKASFKMGLNEDSMLQNKSGSISALLEKVTVNNNNLVIDRPEVQRTLTNFLMNEKVLLDDKLSDRLYNALKQAANVPEEVQPELKEAIKKLTADIATELRTNRNEAGKNSDLSQPNIHTVEKENIKNSLNKEFEKLFVKLEHILNKDDLNPKEFYKDIYRKLEIVREAIESSILPQKAEIINRLDNIENNIRFMNDIYQSSMYLQIPLSLADRSSTAELYILKKDGKRKKINPENVTMFISLNTPNLGQVDTLASMRGKCINLNLRLENSSVIEFIKENYKALYTSLNDKGYRLADIRYSIIDEEASIINIGKIAERETGAGMTSIDYRL